MTILESVSVVVQGLLLIYLGGTAIYLLIFSIFALFPIKKYPPLDFKKRRFAILIPCYQEDEVIFEVTQQALEQNYPASLFDVIIVADKFEKSTIEKLATLPVILFDESFSISTKTRALNHALRNLPENKYDIVVILDADNLMESNFIAHLNDAFSFPYQAIQAHRAAKNLNTNFAVLDAISEEINNNIFRKGHRNAGLSSALIGSAMAFRYDFFKQLMQDVEVVGGFDKELELRLLRDHHLIHYLEDALVLDEKVQNVHVFSRQRRRWLSAQFHYFGKHFIPALKMLFKQGNLDYFNKAFQYIQLPRVLLLGLLLLASFFSLFYNPVWLTLAWMAATGLIIMALLLAVPIKFYNFRTIKALFSLPVGFVFMFLSLLRIRGANRNFIHTKHTFNAFQKKSRK
ncbi:MAG: glycosyltransferase [Bacteroidetes bacterium]|jgi:cellulose synthase/poly-beta-1,6-N-acetylglucosamine synthase-like glycosyltransferase|nr:glycosyltransferase [Bacteroidota bacterium]